LRSRCENQFQTLVSAPAGELVRVQTAVAEVSQTVSSAHLKEIFFGGTRGGGKTDGGLGKWALKEKRQGFNHM
jgi:hypothetical protein